MNLRHQTYAELIEKFNDWAGSDSNIRLAFIVGSRARKNSPADEWSDLDMVIAAENPDKILFADDWLENIGFPKVTFTENTFCGGRERRILFDSGLDVDFAVFSSGSFKELLDDPEILSILNRGMRVLLDKDSLLSGLKLPAEYLPSPAIPKQENFLNLVNDFWYHAVWTAKKLRRGEFLQAKSACDAYMKNLLMEMIKWQACCENGWNYDTWHGSRFFEHWASPAVVEKMRKVYAHYEKEDIWRSLFRTMDLFRDLALETARSLNYPYPEEADTFASGYTALLYQKR